MPWSARAAVGVSGFAVDSGGDFARQWVADQSFTVQATRYLWLSGGFRSRETQVPGLGRPFRELGSVHLSVALQAYPEAVYLLAAGRYTSSPGSARIDDSLVLSEMLNGYLPLSEPGLIAGPSGLVGALLRLRLFGGEALTGFEYFRPGRAEPLEGSVLYPAPFLSLSGQFRHVRNVEYNFRIRFLYFLDETAENRVPAHREGSMVFAEYSALGMGERRAWDTEVGAAAKLTDRNRRNSLRVDPPLAAANDNLQRSWLGLRWRFWQKRSRVWTGLRGEALYRLEDSEIGYEARWEWGLARPLWKEHWTDVRIHGLGAGFDGVSYWGGGMTLAFSLRHFGGAASP
jgi:hypothetical protein